MFKDLITMWKFFKCECITSFL